MHGSAVCNLVAVQVCTGVHICRRACPCRVSSNNVACDLSSNDLRRPATYAYTTCGKRQPQLCICTYRCRTLVLMKAMFLKGFTALLVLGALADVRVDSHRLRVADVDEVDKIEHQRILAELEEVHQLRERLPQDGEASHHCPAQPKSQSCLSTSNSTLLMCKATALSTLQGRNHGMCITEAGILYDDDIQLFISHTTGGNSEIMRIQHMSRSMRMLIAPALLLLCCANHMCTLTEAAVCCLPLLSSEALPWCIQYICKRCTSLLPLLASRWDGESIIIVILISFLFGIKIIIVSKF